MLDPAALEQLEAGGKALEGRTSPHDDGGDRAPLCVKAFDILPPFLRAERRVIDQAVIMDRKMDAALFEKRHDAIVPSEHICLQGVVDILR
jgi:hypothetical protein